MNLGHGELGCVAWPSAKSWRVAECWTVLSVSTPSACEAPAITLFASCADVVHTVSAAREIAASITFFMVPPALSCRALYPFGAVDGRGGDRRDAALYGESRRGGRSRSALRNHRRQRHLGPVVRVFRRERAAFAVFAHQPRQHVLVVALLEDERRLIGGP